jgi:hypothetical protein
MRQVARFTGFATLEGALSRRRTVMQALHRATGVIREYQSDSSSKNPVILARLGAAITIERRCSV